MPKCREVSDEDSSSGEPQGIQRRDGGLVYDPEAELVVSGHTGPRRVQKTWNQPWRRRRETVRARRLDGCGRKRQGSAMAGKRVERGRPQSSKAGICNLRCACDHDWNVVVDHASLSAPDRSKRSAGNFLIHACFEDEFSTSST